MISSLWYKKQEAGNQLVPFQFNENPVLTREVTECESRLTSN